MNTTEKRREEPRTRRRGERWRTWGGRKKKQGISRSD